MIVHNSAKGDKVTLNDGNVQFISQTTSRLQRLFCSKTSRENYAFPKSIKYIYNLLADAVFDKAS